MNNQLQSFAREKLKEGLKKCTEAQQHLFKRMYSHDDLEMGKAFSQAGCEVYES